MLWLSRILSLCLPILFLGCGNVAKTTVATGTGPKASAAATTSTPDKVKVAFVSNNVFDFWKIAQRGTEKAAQDFPVQVEFRMPANGTPQEQRQIIEDLVTKGVKGIAVSVLDAENQADFYNQLDAKGIKVITQDSDLPAGAKRVCFIGTDNFTAGKAAGEQLMAATPTTGKVAIFVGKLDVQNAWERSSGVLAAFGNLKTLAEGKAQLDKLKKEPVTLGKFTVLGVFTDGGEEITCKKVAEDVLTKNPDLAGMIGLWAYNPPQMLLAVKEKGLAKKVKIIGFDESDATLKAIRDGEIESTIVQQPYQFGYQSIKMLNDVVRGDTSKIPASKMEYVPHKVINKANVDEFEKELKKMIGG